ncbi:hypothetical protein ACIA8K_04870 [Catenuloplanes sp. NPDC051500]|uniref:hypothetical protein n=1 Tax=Catenuloplanes sp. NPDC051500 TaxID=3363959 RepID=UPI0037B576BE
MQHVTGFLTSRQRRIAWIGFVIAALHAPVSASLTTDASWLFAVVVAMLVAVVIIADDSERRRPQTQE